MKITELTAEEQGIVINMMIGNEENMYTPDSDDISLQRKLLDYENGLATEFTDDEVEELKTLAHNLVEGDAEYIRQQEQAEAINNGTF